MRKEAGFGGSGRPGKGPAGARACDPWAPFWASLKSSPASPPRRAAASQFPFEPDGRSRPASPTLAPLPQHVGTQEDVVVVREQAQQRRRLVLGRSEQEESPDVDDGRQQ